MTEKVFWKDPYRTTLETTVTSVDGAVVTVAATIFYAFNGGQESDAGTIGGYPVLEAEKDGLEILYRLPEEHTLRVGDAVTMEIDWTRRYLLMRHHFAAEIILQLVLAALSGIQKTGAHISADKSRIDFLWHENISAIFPLLTEKANALIAADLPIVSAFSDEAAERRYWKIEGFGSCRCGGTHLKRTGEVGRVRLKRVNIGKGKERIEIYTDAEEV